MVEEIVYFEVVKLISDEIAFIRAEAIGLLIDILDQFSDPFMNTKVVPILREEISKDQTILVYMKLAQKCGPLSIGLKGYLKSEILNLLKKLMSKELKLRAFIAYNMPGIIIALGSEAILLDILTELIEDPDINVKNAVSLGIHEIASRIHNTKASKKMFMDLLENLNTQNHLLRHMSSLISIIEPHLLLLKSMQVLSSYKN